MDTSGYDEKISEFKKQRDLILTEMIEVYQKFTDSTIDFIKKWSVKQIEKYIGLEHELTLSKDEHDLKNMKTQSNDLMKEARSLVVKNINTGKYWVHLWNKKDLLDFYSKNNNYSRNLENMIKRPLSIIMGYSGKILINFGYVNPNYQNSEWSIYNGRTVRYVENKIELNDEMREYLNEYAKKSDDLKEIIDKIEIAKDDKEKFKAINRWKQVEID